jgi:hypothetical protein
MRETLDSASIFQCIVYTFLQASKEVKLKILMELAKQNSQAKKLQKSSKRPAGRTDFYGVTQNCRAGDP